MNQLPAGRELDALVAKALGYVRVPVATAKRNPLGAEDFVFTVAKDIPAFDDGVYIRHVDAGDFARFAPSTDIAAAFQLLEKMAHWDLDFDEDRSLEYVCEVGFHIDKVEGRGGGMCKMRGAWAETAPLAICRAVLKVFTEEAACES